MNPISYARYLSAYSTTALAKKLEVSRQYISRLEQGLYDKPNAQVLKWTAEILNKNVESPLSSSAVEQLYKEWQWQQRESAKLNKVVRPLVVTEYDKISQPAFRESGLVYYHPIFKQWREGYWVSAHSFCVDMCLHPSPVVDYEEGNTHTMPNQLKKVLTQLQLVGEGFKTSER